MSRIAALWRRMRDKTTGLRGPQTYLNPAVSALYDVDLVGGKLGEGASATVWSCVEKATGEHCALKQMHTRELSRRARREMEMEISILKNLHHPNILRSMPIRRPPIQ